MTETLSSSLPDRVEDLTELLLQKAEAADLKLVTAESCTGGLLASLLTDIEGRSHVFERGFVVYSEASKCELLGLSPAQIDQFGAVSRVVAIEMAEGALNASNGDIALAVTGFAGPGAPGEEAGLVHFACAREGRPTAHLERRFGDIGRGPTRVACLEVALQLMIDVIE